VPIKWRDQVLGILDVQSDQLGTLTADDQLVMEGLCSQIATVIQSNQLLIEANVFRQLAAASGQGIAIATLDGKLTYVNPELCRMIGVSKPEGLLGRPFMDYRPANMVQQIHSEILPAVMEEGQWAGELAIKIQSGRVIITQENFLLLRDERQNPYLLAFVVTDITARKHNDAEMQESINEIERLNQMMSREAWQTFRETAKLPPGYLFDQLSLQTAENLWMPEIVQAAKRREFVHSETDNPAAVAPLAVRGEVVGALGVYDDPQHPLNPDDLAVIEDVATQVALALENARLFEDIQRRAARERLIGDVTARVRESLDMDTLLQIAVREMQAALKLSEVEVQITGKESLAR
jgi:PAS domain S-box-containing protein